MTKLAKYLIKDFKGDGDKSKPSIKFFRSHGAYGYMIWLTVISIHDDKKNISIEELVSIVDKYGSRRTIIDFINKSVEAKYLEKKISNDDKRKIFIIPSDNTIKEFSEWSNTFIKNII